MSMLDIGLAVMCFLALGASVAALILTRSNKSDVKDIKTVNGTSVNSTDVLAFSNGISLTSKDGTLTLSGGKMAVDGDFSVQGDTVLYKTLVTEGQSHFNGCMFLTPATTWGSVLNINNKGIVNFFAPTAGNKSDHMSMWADYNGLYIDVLSSEIGGNLWVGSKIIAST